MCGLLLKHYMFLALSLLMSRDTRWNGVFGGSFQRLAEVIVFLSSVIVVQTKRHFTIIYATKYSRYLGSLVPRFLRPALHFKSREEPGDEVEQKRSAQGQKGTRKLSSFQLYLVPSRLTIK